MPLALTSVEEIFTRLIARYGMAEWSRKWEGLDLNVVKADWSASLGGIPDENIFFALENLPATRVPPNAGEFRKICLEFNGGQAKRKRLPHKPQPADPERVKRELAKMLAFKNSRTFDRFAWARELKRRELAGEDVTEAERRMWREGLKLEVIPTDVPIVISPIADHVLPPGMRKDGGR